MKPSPDHQVRIVKAALNYVGRGWLVFPAPPNGKKQGLRCKADNGERWGSVRTVEEVREVFGVEYLRKRFHLSRCNIGVCTGAASGIVVLDVDTAVAHGRDGVSSLRALEKQHGRLPKTKTAITPSGGLQMFFKHPGGDLYIKCSASKIGAGLDVKADGGMVVAPPSWRPDRGYYRWARAKRCGDDVVPMPDWLLELVTADAKKRGGAAKNFFELFGIAELFKPPSITELSVMCAGIPNEDVGWDDWNRMAMALYAATGGSADGLRLFQGWSAKSDKYDASATAERWEAIEGCPPNEISAGSLYHWAAEAMGEDWQERFADGSDPELDALVEAFLRLLGRDE